MNRNRTRRDFLQTTAATSIGLIAASNAAEAKEDNHKKSRLRFAGIGVGGKGHSDILQTGKLGEIVAICDIDQEKLDTAEKELGAQGHKPKKYHDYRKMLDEMKGSIDGVTVSTPDHSHAYAAIYAMRLGKHVYCQKPLTHSVYEARLMRETAAKMKVATQMGNQGSALDGLRRVVEIVQAGVLGKVAEAHVWTNRPIWPQGSEGILRVAAAKQVAMAALHGKTITPTYPKTPDSVKWDLFLGPAKERPYDAVYHPFSWRGWLDFGTGALGDMACHTANMAFRALKLGYPTSIVAEEVQGRNEETYPTGARIVFQFPARENFAPTKFTWYEGINGDRERYLPKAKLFHGKTPAGSGSMLVGEKAILYSPDDYGAEFVILGKNAKEVEKAIEKVPVSLPRNGHGDLGMKEEWIAAILGGPAASSSFDFAGHLTETILLGNIALRMGKGKLLEWDGPKMSFKNSPQANRFLKREYRKGWEL